MSEWAQATCPACSAAFLLAAAHDAMLVDGHPEGYQLWGGCTVVSRAVICEQGSAVLIDVRGHLARVVKLTYGTASGMCLAGGVGLKFVPQGYILVSVAPDPNDAPRYPAPMDLMITGIGYGQNMPNQPFWRELMLQARVAADTAPDLVPILVCNAVEAFLEEELESVATDNRPVGWDRSVTHVTGCSLADLLGPSRWADLRALLNYRHAVAHGKDQLRLLPDRLRADEYTWRTRTYELEEAWRLSPANRFALSIGLEAIRVVRQQMHETAHRKDY